MCVNMQSKKARLDVDGGLQKEARLVFCASITLKEQLIRNKTYFYL